ncbi:MAG: hypothetical protein ACRC4N_18155 [Gammaproteobacteria bacterium]
MHHFIKNASTIFIPQTATQSPHKEPPPKPKLTPKPASPPPEVRESSIAMVEQALERMLMKSPSRRDSYSDSTDEEKQEEDLSPGGQNGSVLEIDDTIRSAYANTSVSQSIDRTEASCRSGTQLKIIERVENKLCLNIHEYL